MVKTTLPKYILALNLGSLSCYGLTALAVLTPLRKVFQTNGFFSGYESIAVLVVGLGAAGILAQAAGVLSLVHLVRARRWSWELTLSVLTVVVLPGALAVWALVSG